MENEKDILKELIGEKVIEKETAKTFGPTYFPEPTRDQILESEKLELQKRLVDISKEQGDAIWQEHARQKEIEKRKSVFKRMQYEKQLNANGVNLFWESNRDFSPGFHKKTNPGPI